MCHRFVDGVWQDCRVTLLQRHPQSPPLLHSQEMSRSWTHHNNHPHQLKAPHNQYWYSLFSTTSIGCQYFGEKIVSLSFWTCISSGLFLKIETEFFFCCSQQCLLWSHNIKIKLRHFKPPFYIWYITHISQFNVYFYNSRVKCQECFPLF